MKPENSFKMFLLGNGILLNILNNSLQALCLSNPFRYVIHSDFSTSLCCLDRFPRLEPKKTFEHG